ncbi:MAG: hypothetical protein AAF433_04375 [Bacteroidota bacterium]
MKLWFTAGLFWLGMSLQAQLDFSQVNEWEHPLLDSLVHKVEQGDYEQLTSVLVAQRGVLLYEKYFNGNDQSSRHNCRSVTKTIASLLVGIATDQSAIQGVSDPIARYLEPLGITDYGLHYSPRGELNTAGGSEYRSRDFLRLIQLCLQEGQWDDQQIISADYLEAATSPKVQARENVNYGYLFWLPSYGPEGEQYAAFAMFGNGGNKVVAIPELELSVVITSTNYGNRRAHGYSDEILNEFIIPALTD